MFAIVFTAGVAAAGGVACLVHKDEGLKVPGWILLVAACVVLISGPAAASPSDWICKPSGFGQKAECYAKK